VRIFVQNFFSRKNKYIFVVVLSGHLLSWNLIWNCGNSVSQDRKMAAGGKRVSCGLDFACPSDITVSLQSATDAK